MNTSTAEAVCAASPCCYMGYHSKERELSCTAEASGGVGGNQRESNREREKVGVTNVQHYVRGGRKRHNMSGSRCLHLPHIPSIDVLQPTALIVFGLEMSILLQAEVVQEQGLMQGSGASTVSAV